MSSELGKWRSPVAHSAGGRAVAGSNPVFPTTFRLKQIGAGKSYWADLRLIRESRKITLDEVQAQTKIPMSVLKDFERDGLSLHEQMNDVYCSQLVAAFAGAVGVDPILARKSYAASRTGVYDGSLAVTYLGWTPPRPEARRQRRLSRPTVAITTPEIRSSTGWRMAGLVFLAVVLAGSITWVSVTPGSQMPPSEMTTSIAYNGEISGARAQASVLGDTIEVKLVARYGVLNPLLVQVDQGRSNPYWLDLGDSMTLAGTRVFNIRGEIDHLAIYAAQQELPIDRFAKGRTVVINREALEQFLLKNRP